MNGRVKQQEKYIKMKRGTDHNWEIRRYDGDMALYANCKCGFQYNCSSKMRQPDGTLSLNPVATLFYSYCPACGAYKKWYNEEPIRIHRFLWE